MELPVIGKRTDVFNKKAITALSRGDEAEAIRQWEEGQKMKDEHFDSTVNYLIHQWRHGVISDQQVEA